MPAHLYNMACQECEEQQSQPSPCGDKPCGKPKRAPRKKPVTPTDCETPVVSPAPIATPDNPDCDDRWNAGVKPAQPPMGKPDPVATQTETATGTNGTYTYTRTSTQTSTRPSTGGQEYMSPAMNKVFYKDNCPDGYISEPYVFTLRDGAFRSAVSQEYVDQLAKDYIDKIGPLEANKKGVCTYAPLGATVFSDPFIGNPTDCPPLSAEFFGMRYGPAVCEE